MAAPKGHPLWGNPIKPKKYTPEQLWEGACEYFEWCNENPVIIVEQTKMPQKLDSSMMKTMKPAMVKAFLKQTIEMPHERAYTVEGLCIYLNISRETFYEYAKGEGTYNTYPDTCTRIKDIIDNQHFIGGMAGTFNAGIVTRKLGLAEKTQSDISVKMPNITVQNQETADELKKFIEGK